jgi:hypothetical protein
MDESSSKLLQVILKYPKIFFGWIRKSSFKLWNCPFSSLWLTSGCTQNLFRLFALVLSRRAHTATDSTKSIPHTLTDSEEMWERSVSFAVRAHSQEILGRCGCFTAAAKKPLVRASPKMIGWVSLNLVLFRGKVRSDNDVLLWDRDSAWRTVTGVWSGCLLLKINRPHFCGYLEDLRRFLFKASVT